VVHGNVGNKHRLGKHFTVEQKKKISDTRKGKALGKNNGMFIYNINFKGNNNPNWKGGNRNFGGYSMLKIDGKYVMAHRLVVEKFLGRKLKRSEIIHHIDSNKVNNLLKNLLLLTNKTHAKLHANAYDFIVEKGLIEEYLNKMGVKRFCE